jgi:hypothetical protein
MGIAFARLAFWECQRYGQPVLKSIDGGHGSAEALSRVNTVDRNGDLNEARG